MRASKTVVLGTLVVIAAILTAWGLRDRFWPRPDRYVMVPLTISGDRQSGVKARFLLAKGSRQIDLDEQGQGPVTLPDGIVTNYHGGACIVMSVDDLYPLMSQRANCARDGDCGAGGYCEPQARRCWVKPPGIGDGACRKSRQEGGTWRPNILHPLPRQGALDLGPARLPSGRVRARVLTCLETATATMQTGCPNSGPQSVSRWGDVTPL